jgi:excisionase family DNA binding protein
MTAITAPVTAPITASVMAALTVEDAARRLGTLAAEIYRDVDQGRLPAYRDARGRVVVPEGALARRPPRRGRMPRGHR